jgi:hypothetical protein
VGHLHQLVGAEAHGGDHHHDVVARLLDTDDALADGADALDVGDGRAAVLLDDDRQGKPSSGPLRPRIPPGSVRFARRVRRT